VSIQSIGLGDGVYDKLTNNEIAQLVHGSTTILSADVSQTVSRSIEVVMVEVFNRQVTDNVSIVMVAFDAFYRKIGAANKVQRCVIQA
jgi:serine/threonine protein phosphatase PrpC